MNVPPLMTAAVKATANAPSDRLPRKYFSRKLPLRWAKLATTPRPSEISVNSTSATSVGGCAWMAATLFMEAPFPDLLLQLGRVVLAEVVVGHHEAGEPEGEQCAGSPGRHDPPEDPRGHAEDRPHVGLAERVIGPDVAEQ